MLLVNRTHGLDKMDEIVDGAGPAARPSARPAPSAGIEPDRSAWPRFTGSYLGDWTGMATIRAADDRLWLDWNGTIIPLSAYRDDVYFGRKPGGGAAVSVGFVPEGGQDTRYLMLDSSPCERFEPDRSFEPDPTAWAAYAGRYAGDDTLTIWVSGGRLMVHSANEGVEMPSVALSNTRFAAMWAARIPGSG